MKMLLIQKWKHYSGNGNEKVCCSFCWQKPFKLANFFLYCCYTAVGFVATSVVRWSYFSVCVGFLLLLLCCSRHFPFIIMWTSQLLPRYKFEHFVHQSVILKSNCKTLPAKCYYFLSSIVSHYVRDEFLLFILTIC